MQAVLQVNLLGGFQLFYDGKPFELAHSGRLQSFFAYLILHRPAPLVREQLASVFWPETSEFQARTNLRNIIYQLRKALPFVSEFIEFNNHSLAWLDESRLRLDIDEFKARLAAAPEDTPGIDALESAIQLYKGDLLPACFDDWILLFREELRGVYLAALDRLATLAEEAGDYPQALLLGRRLVLAEHLSPAANQRLMVLYSLLGDRPAALKAYRDYARRLWQEVGVEPDEHIQDLFERIQAAAKTSSLNAINSPAGKIVKPVARETSLLLGRTAEWRQLLAYWQTAAAGNVQIVFLTGEAGIGKTRLVSRLVNWAELQAIPAATAACFPAEGSPPYGPVGSWIKAHPLPALDKVWLAEIGRLFPEVVQNVPGLPHLEPVREAWQRQRLFEALARALLTRRRAQILVLEDVQWCDRDTLEWLHFLLRFDPQAALLVVVTLRHGEIPPAHPLWAFQSALQAEDRYNEIELPPLSMADSLLLIEQASQQTYHRHTLDSATAANIYQHAGGNPLFLIETVRVGPTTPDNLFSASRRIHAVLTRRLDQLSQGTRDVAALAATLEHEFDLAVLRQASEESDEQLVAVLDELLRARIIQEASAGNYDFTHDLLRQATLSGLSTAHRRLLHRKAAEAYEHLDQDSLQPRHGEIGSHYERAGLALQAVHHYHLAAQAAAHIFANADALGYLQRAIILAESVGIGDQRAISSADFAALLKETGELLARDGKYPAAVAYFERALAQPFAQSGLWKSRVYRNISDAWIPQYRHDLSYAALDLAEQALEIKPPAGTLEEQQEWLQIQLDRGQLYYWDNYPDRIEELLLQIELLGASVGRVAQQNNLLSLRYQARMRRERYRVSNETVQIVRQRLDQAEKLDDAYNLAIAQFQYGFALLWHGDLAPAREWMQRSNAALAYMGARLWQLRCLAYLSVVSRKLHEAEHLRNELPPLLELGRALSEYTYIGIGLANQGWLAWQDGDAAQAEQSCREANEVWLKMQGCVFFTLSEWVLLAVNHARSDLSAAATTARALMNPDPTFQPVAEPQAGLLRQALAACESGQAAAAAELFRRALDAARVAGEL